MTVSACVTMHWTGAIILDTAVLSQYIQHSWWARNFLCHFHVLQCTNMEITQKIASCTQSWGYSWHPLAWLAWQLPTWVGGLHCIRKPLITHSLAALKSAKCYRGDNKFASLHQYVRYCHKIGTIVFGISSAIIWAYFHFSSIRFNQFDLCEHVIYSWAGLHWQCRPAQE